VSAYGGTLAQAPTAPRAATGKNRNAGAEEATAGSAATGTGR
jgi:hypothetical protein